MKIKNILLASFLVLLLVFGGCSSSENVSSNTNAVDTQDQDSTSNMDVDTSSSDEEITAGIVDEEQTVEIGELI